MTTPRLQVALGGLGVTLAVAHIVAIGACQNGGCVYPAPLGPAHVLLWALGGLAYLGVGLVAWQRRPGSRLGLLMVGVGLAWFLFPGDGLALSSLVGRSSVLVTFLHATRELWVVAVVVLVGSFPDGRLAGPERLVAGGFATFYLARNLSTSLFWVPAAEGFGGVRNLLMVRPDPVLVSRLEILGDLDDPLLFAVVIWMLWRAWRASPPRRRAVAPLLWAGVPWLASFVLGTARLVADTQGLFDLENFLGRVGLLVLPFGLLAILLHRRLAHARLGRLLEDLSNAVPVGSLQAHLAEALGDPSLTVAFPQGNGHGHIDADGHPVDLDTVGPGRQVTTVEDGGQPVAALVHDPALSDDPELLEAATAAARLVLDTERLHATIRAQLRQVQASRARIVEATDAERRRVERDLHDGAQQRLVTLGLALSMARARLDEDADPTVVELLEQAAGEIDVAIDELRELARGLHPAILEEGLGPAVEELVDRLPVPVETDIAVEKLPAPVQATCYFVIAEGLTNVAKHARAGSAAVRVTIDDDRVVVVVSDDGLGGADTTGAGLVGLADRVAAAGGSLHLHDTEPGTLLRASIPLRAPDAGPARAAPTTGHPLDSTGPPGRTGPPVRGGLPATGNPSAGTLPP